MLILKYLRCTRMSCWDKFGFSYRWCCFSFISLRRHCGVYSETRIHRSRHSSPDIFSVCVFEMHILLSWYVVLLLFKSLPAHFTSDFPLYLPVSFLLSSPHPAFIIFLPPASSFPACERGIRRRKAIYDHQPMARFNPFASSTQIRASEIKRDKQK